MRHTDIDIDLLRCFKAVAEYGGFTAASLALGLTQPAVSLKIQRLEQRIGRRVFVRKSRGLAVTTEGQTLLLYAGHLLELNDQMIQRLTAAPTLRRLRIALDSQFEPAYLSRIVARFARDYPDIQIETDTGDYGVLMHGQELGDIDVVIAPMLEENARATAISSEELVWAAAIGWQLLTAQSRNGLPVDIIMHQPGTLLHDRTRTLLQQSGINYDVKYTSRTQGVIAAVENGLGAALLARSMLPPSLRRLDGLPDPGEVRLAACWNDGSEGVAQLLLRFIRQNLPASIRPAP